MSIQTKRESSLPPPGVHTDYDIIHSIGIGGIIDDEVASTVLNATIENNLDESNNTVEETKRYFINHNTKKYIRAFVAFRELAVCYPITAQNWHSGERIPLIHAEETSTRALTLAFQGHYKSAYQSLREIIELVILQLHFYKLVDKVEIGQWGRGEIRTPSLRNMLREIRNDELLKRADVKLSISNNIIQNYDDLGAFIHTRGISTTSMGLTGSNMIHFSKNALDMYLDMSIRIYHDCVLILSTFFPTSIISVNAFNKLGHFDPVWIPRENSVNCLRSVLTTFELQTLEDIAICNTWFQTLLHKVDSLKCLSKEEIEETYIQFKKLTENNVEEYMKHIKTINSQLE